MGLYHEDTEPLPLISEAYSTTLSVLKNEFVRRVGSREGDSRASVFFADQGVTVASAETARY
jgi:hypothetical protein